MAHVSEINEGTGEVAPMPEKKPAPKKAKAPKQLQSNTGRELDCAMCGERPGTEADGEGRLVCLFCLRRAQRQRRLKQR